MLFLFFLAVLVSKVVRKNNRVGMCLSASAGPCTSHSATHTPADDVAIARGLDVPISPEWHFCSTQMPYNSSHRADVVLGVLFSRAGASSTHTTALPAGTRTEYEYLSALVTPALIVRPVSSPLAPMRPPPTPPSCGTPRLIAETSSPPVRRCLPVEACTRLQSSPSASAVVSSAGMKPIRILSRHSPLPRRTSHSPPRRTTACETNDELTVTADNDRVGGSINPPSLCVNCEPPSLHVSCEALPPLRVNCDTPAAYTNDSADAEQRTPGAKMSSERRRRCRSSASQSRSRSWTMKLPWWAGSGSGDARALFPSSTPTSVRPSHPVGFPLRALITSSISSFTNCVHPHKPPCTPIMPISSRFPAFHPSLTHSPLLAQLLAIPP
ncbi:hypothetical protein K438DRAFT_1985976 [Mycena galopus ATCC 62051]|nr:hypothetical protein K438DRAFT_1985976 [Mycena galopus ATCC 62051]